MPNNRGCRWGIRAGLIGGAAVAAAMFCAGAALADDGLSSAPVLDGSLSTAAANFADTEKALDGTDAPNEVLLGQPARLAELNQTDYLGHLQASENALSAPAGPLSGSVGWLLFGSLNRDLADTSDALLHADQSLAAANAAESVGLLGSWFEMVGPELQLQLDMIDGELVIDAAYLIDGP